MSSQAYFRMIVDAHPTAATVVCNGQQVFSGQLGGDETLGVIFDAPTMTLPIEPGSSGTMSISITSGIARVGPLYPIYDVSANLAPYYPNTFPDCRGDYLINGQAPEWPVIPATPMPGGSPENPDWDGWHFELGAGETMTVTVTVPETPTSVPAP